MKIFIAILILATLGISAQAQDAKVIAELAASSEKIVKNAPFSADAVSESVQMLVDGNRIVRSSTSKLYRNSEGRFRREISNGSGGIFGSVYSVGPGITILDPVAGHRYLLDSNLKTVYQVVLKTTAEQKIKGDLAEAQRAIVTEKLRTEIRSTAGNAPVVIAGSLNGAAGPVSAVGIGNGVGYSAGAQSKYESRTEQLGMQNIEGIDAEGVRTTTTIPAGAIGNERPIEIVYERWYSKDLQLVVMSKHSDPRFGEQTYRLTNIVRSEPDPSLFAVPTSYKLITEPSNVFRIDNIRVEVEKAAAAKAAQSGVTVVKPKP